MKVCSLSKGNCGQRRIYLRESERYFNDFKVIMGKANESDILSWVEKKDGAKSKRFSVRACKYSFEGC